MMPERTPMPFVASPSSSTRAGGRSRLRAASSMAGMRRRPGRRRTGSTGVEPSKAFGLAGTYGMEQFEQEELPSRRAGIRPVDKHEPSRSG